MYIHISNRGIHQVHRDRYPAAVIGGCVLQIQILVAGEDGVDGLGY